MAAAGNVTALCQLLLAGPCFNYTGVAGLWSNAAPVPSLASCQAWFLTVSPTLGYANDTWGNTIGCRQNYATWGQTNNYYCKFASFTGGGICGNALNNTCSTIWNFCNGNANLNYTNYGACVTDLTPFANIFGSKQGSTGAAENSLECRAYHASAANLTGDGSHCGHVQSYSPPCVATGGVPNIVSVNADHYCGLTEVACTGSDQQYAGAGSAQHASCLNSFATFPVGPGVAVTSNPDQSSRQYHVNVAATSGGNPSAGHCQHAGPSGGGVLGTTYQAWQNLTTLSLCATTSGAYISAQLAQALAQWPTQLTTVAPPDTPAGAAAFNSNTPPAGNTDTCRIYHLSVAAGSQAAANVHCVHGGLLGGGQCPPDWSTICILVLAGCPSAYTNQAACMAAFQPYITQGKFGSPTDTTQDDISCRLYYATQAVTAVGMGGTANATVCGNVVIASNPVCTASLAPSVAPTNAPTASNMTAPSMKSSATDAVLSAGLLSLMLLW